MPKRKQPQKKTRPTKPRAKVEAKSPAKSPPTPAKERKPLREWKEKFLEHFARSGNVLRSAQFAGIDRGTAYKAFKSDEDFREAWRLAEADAGDEAEEVAVDNRVLFEPVTYEGQLVFVWVDAAGNYLDPDGDDPPETIEGAKRVPLMKREVNSALIALICKARNPGRFRENVKLTHTGPNGGPLEIETTKKPQKEVDFNALAAALEKHALRSVAGRVRADSPQEQVDPDHADG